jgi:hypothetical protein
MKSKRKCAKLKTETQEVVIMESEQEQRSTSEIVNLVFKAVAVSMSVAAMVLGALGTANIPLLVTLLSIGLFCLAVASLKS